MNRMAIVYTMLVEKGELPRSKQDVYAISNNIYETFLSNGIQSIFRIIMNINKMHMKTAEEVQ